MRRIPCFMCDKRPARPLTAKRDGQVYAYGQGVVLFCTLRCAANYGLVHGAWDAENTWHYCPATREWEACAAHECDAPCCKGA